MEAKHCREVSMYKGGEFNAEVYEENVQEGGSCSRNTCYANSERSCIKEI